MRKLLDLSLKKFIIYAALVLAASIPVYYFAIYLLWQYEMDEHNIILSPAAHREDKLIIIGAVTLLTVCFFILLLGVFVFVNRRISRRLWTPFYESLSTIKDFDLHQTKEVVFASTTIGEFKELNESLEKLIKHSVGAYYQQKEFADNASHELQTPLAIVQSKLERLMQSSALTAEHLKMIEDALGALARVNRINKNLLLLTRIENSQFRDTKQINLYRLLENSIAVFQPFVEDKELTVLFEASVEVTVHANSTLVEILVNNLLTNAIQNSGPHEQILISSDKKTLEIANPGRATLEEAHLFRRFSKVSDGAKGTGLGLALCKQICDRYQWELSYNFDGKRHLFVVRF